MRSLAKLVSGLRETVAALHAAVAENGFDLTVSDGELHDATIALQRAQSALAIANARVLERWDTRHVWAPGGHRSAASRLALDAKLSKRSAQRELHRARTLASMPATAAAVADGRLSIDHADLFARANQPHRRQRFAQHEATLVSECSRLRFADCQRLIDYWCQRVDSETDNTPDPAATRSVLFASPTLDGRLEITGSLNPVHGEILLNELDRLERQIALHDRQQGAERTPAERRALALVEMARRSASTPAGAQAPKPLFTLHAGEGTLKHLCELANGTVIRPEQIREYLDNAIIETVLFSGPSTILSVSTQRSFTGTLRRAIEARDRHCQHPTGCDVPARNCDVDHIIPWSQGGETSQFNGRLQCTTHNRHADKHDHNAQPHPTQPVDYVHHWRAKYRWHLQHQHPDSDDPLTANAS